MPTPILVGVGQYTDRIEDPEYRALSVVELGAEAARRALNDALALDQLAPQIDVVAGVRQFETSTPDAVAAFGRSNNFPRSVMQRLGQQPQRAVLEVGGGQSPQHLVNEFAEAIAAGEAQLVLLVGAEAISTQRHLLGQGQKPDWSETVAGSLEDRGYGLDGILTADLMRHRLFSAIPGYALFDNARRARLGQTSRRLSPQHRRAVRAIHARGRAEPLCHGAQSPQRRRACDRHRAQPPDRRPLYAPGGLARSGEPGRRAAAHLGRTRARAGHPRA